MLKRKANIFVTILFTFVAFMLIGTTNVNAGTVSVSNEQQLKAALDGVKEVEGSEVKDTDTDTTEVKLTEDITLSEDLIIYAITDLTLDLNGHTIDGINEEDNNSSKSVTISYGSNGYQTFNSGSLTIKDSSDTKTGAIKSHKLIGLTSNNYNTDEDKHYALIIENGKFYVSVGYKIFELTSITRYIKNTIFDFQIKDGYFENNSSDLIFLHANEITTNNVTLNVNFDKLTVKGLNTRLIYSYEPETGVPNNFKISDVVSEDSKVLLKHSQNGNATELTDRDVSVSELNALNAAWINALGITSLTYNFDTIEIIRKEGFDVSDVTLTETYGYTTATPVDIKIKNRGTNSLQIKDVTVSEELSKFVVDFPAHQVTVKPNVTDTSYKIKAGLGLDAGTYSGEIIVTDMNDKTYTATVTLEVKRKSLGDISISKEGWTYDGTAHNEYTISGLDGVPVSKYKIEYSEENANMWSGDIPKTTGNYKIRLTITDPNLEQKSVESNFEIKKNNKAVQIIANSNKWTYDGKDHKDTGYIVTYSGEIVADGILPTGDAISDVNISASVKDVKDNISNNNIIHSFELPNYNCYSDVKEIRGTISIAPITNVITVTASSGTKAYDGTALRNNNYTYTDGVLLSGDTLVVTISGEQTYVGTSENKVESVKVMRDGEDITANYTFGEHVNGTLKVTAIDQPLEIADQTVATNSTLTRSELEAVLSGDKGNVSFKVKKGTAGTYDEINYGGFRAGNISGDVTMTVTAQEFDVNGDGTAEYNATEKDFVIHVVEKEEVTFSSIAPNQKFTYTGGLRAPSGIFVIGNKVPSGEIEVRYAGSGDTIYAVSSIPPKDAGTYIVTYKVPDSNPRYKGQVTYNFTITKAQYSKVTISGPTTFKYTGSAIKPSANGFWNNRMTASGDIEKTDVGDYTIKVSFNDKFNYAWADGSNDDLELHWSITKATPTITISNLSQKVGSIVEPTYTVAPAVTNGTVKVEYKLSTADDTEYTETKPTKAGTYLVRVSVSGDKNLENKSEVATLEIARKTTGGGGGGSSTTTFTITVKEGENAEITPNATVKLEKGESKTFKIKAKEGYEIEDVLVDGKSVGAVNEYTFKDVKAKHTLEVKVKKVEEEPTTPETFKDVKKNEWYFEAIEYVAKKGLMNGTGNDEFSPNGATTRGMIVTILYRLEGEPEVEECSFTDVPSGAYYAKAIAWAEKNGIVLGLGDGKFGPDDEITREQLAAIMYRYSMYKKYSTSVDEDTNILSYNDIQDLADYAFQAMQYACGEGLISGMGDGNLAPKGNATRAQVATILMRYCEKYIK